MIWGAILWAQRVMTVKPTFQAVLVCLLTAGILASTGGIRTELLGDPGGRFHS